MRKFIYVLILILISFPVSGCKKKEEVKVAEKTLNVRVEPAKKIKMRPYIEAVGTLKPYAEVTVSSETGGLLRELAVDEGSRVAKGMLLVKIDDTNYRLDVDRAEAALGQAEASLSAAKTEYKRKESLFKENLSTEQQFEAASTALRLAEAQARVAGANLSLAKEGLVKTNIYSPLDGFVKEKTVSEGTLIRAGSPLLTVIKTDPIKLVFGISEKDTGAVKAGQELKFSVDAMPGQEFTARVRKILPSLDEKTRTLGIEAEGANRASLLKPGLFAKIMLYTGGQKDAVAVHQNSLLYEGEKMRLFVIEGGTAKERFVKAGQKLDEHVVIEEGVKEGESIVVAGQQNLFDGAKVAVKD